MNTLVGQLSFLSDLQFISSNINDSKDDKNITWEISSMVTIYFFFIKKKKSGLVCVFDSIISAT